MVIRVSDIPEPELEITAVRSSGPGGQNVNKVSTAIHLRFNIAESSLPDLIKARLMELRDRRIVLARQRDLVLLGLTRMMNDGTRRVVDG